MHDPRRTCATLLVDLDVHPPRSDADPRAHPVRDHDGDLTQVSSAQTRAALKRLGESLDGWRRDRYDGLLLYSVAVRDAKGTASPVGDGPCVGTTGFEPATP